MVAIAALIISGFSLIVSWYASRSWIAQRKALSLDRIGKHALKTCVEAHKANSEWKGAWEILNDQNNPITVAEYYPAGGREKAKRIRDHVAEARLAMIDLTLSFTQASVYEFPGADAACHEFQKLIDVYDKLIKIATGLENHEITPLATQGLLNIHPCGLRKVVERVESDFFEKFYKPTYKPLIETRWLRAWKSLTKCAAVSETGK